MHQCCYWHSKTDYKRFFYNEQYLTHFFVSISNRAQLAKEMHIEKLMKKNKVCILLLYLTSTCTMRNLHLYRENALSSFVVSVAQCKRKADVKVNSVVFRIICNIVFLFVQELPEPFRTMLEVMVKFIKDQGDLRPLSSSGTDRANQKPNSSRYQILYNNAYLKVCKHTFKQVFNTIVMEFWDTNRWHNAQFSL